MQFDFKKEERKRKIKKLLDNKFFLVVFVLCVIAIYIEFNRILDDRAYYEAFNTIYGSQEPRKMTKEEKEEWHRLAEAPFTIRSENIQNMYDDCLNGNSFRCSQLADYEKSQGHIRNYMNFIKTACLLDYSYCSNYAQSILDYYSDKNLAKSEATKYYQIGCDNGDNWSCEKIRELNK